MIDDQRSTNPELDEESIARLVRDVADDWTMPPVRLDQPTWRDRVRPGRGSGAPLMRGWFERSVRAAGLAVALVVVVAIVGVFLVSPPRGGPAIPGSSNAAAQGSPTPSADPSTTQTRAPSDAQSLPSVTTALMQLDQGGFALVDLATSELAAPFVRPDRDSLVSRLDDGSLMCLCIEYGDLKQLRPTHASVTLRRFTADGEAVSSEEVAAFDGAADPRDGIAGVPMEPEHVVVSASLSATPDVAYVGYAYREHPVWRSGVLRVDLGDGHVIDRIELPDTTDGDGDTRRVLTAPNVAGEANGDVIVGRHYYDFAPADSTEPSYEPGVDVFETTLTVAQTLDAAKDCGEVLEQAGPLDDGGLWLSCSASTGYLYVQRFDAHGSLLSKTPMPAFMDLDGSTSLVAPDGKSLYVWQPVTLTLTRLDLATGKSTAVTAPRSSAATDLFSQLGEWLIPSARAKVFLKAGLVLSPDGTRLYALGVASPDVHGESGSTGLYAIDLGDTMTATRWEPAADLVSLAVSGDGRYVYVAGVPGVDASGAATGQRASISVYDASTGEVTFQANDLGFQVITFVDRLLR